MTVDIELLPSSVAAFTEALHGDRGSLDAWLEVHDEREVRAHVEAYARANIGVATAVKDAEIEALRAEVAVERNLKADAIHACALANIRAERLAEALRRYRNEVPLGHQPHMLAHEVDDLLRDQESE